MHILLDGELGTKQDSIHLMYSRSMKGSLMATTVASGFVNAARKTIRPMRPKPLIPIWQVIVEQGIEESEWWEQRMRVSVGRLLQLKKWKWKIEVLVSPVENNCADHLYCPRSPTLLVYALETPAIWRLYDFLCRIQLHL